MLIDCGQCEFRAVACGDCLVTALVENEPGAAAAWKSEPGRNKDVSNSGARRKGADITVGHHPGPRAADRARQSGDAPVRHAFGALELRGLSALAAGGLVPPLRYRPVNKPARVIVAL